MTKTKPKPLIVARFRGGDNDCTSAKLGDIWLDLEDWGINAWHALVSSEAVAKEIATRCDAELLTTWEWDGAPFGDGNCGVVRSDAPGELVVEAGNAAGVDSRALPRGWRAVKGG